MRILIVGAGALGGYVGACLTRAGEDVTLLDLNQARVRLLNETGLFVSQAGQEESCIPLKVVAAVPGPACFDLVFIAVKTYQTEEALREVLPATGPGTRFLSMQNGIGNADTIAGLVGAERVVCGITYHSIQHVGPARLQYRVGIKPIQIAPFAGEVTPEIEAIAALFRRAGLDTAVVANLDHVIWQKLLHNAVINPVSAVTGLTCREILGDQDLLAFMRDLCTESLSVMRARGVPVVEEEDPFQPLLGSLRALGKNRPSMWQDLARGQRTEVDAINGAIVREAERLGLAAPHNAALVRFIHSRERHTFLRRQELVRRLQLEPGNEAPAARKAARPTPLGPDAGLAVEAPPLESTRVLKELVHAYYRDLEAASDDPDRRVACCSGLGPVELLRAFDLAPYFPENHAALIGASRQAGRYIGRASVEGYSQFASSAMRSDIGALLSGESPLVGVHGLRGPPRPDVVVYSTNTSPALVGWFEFYGSYYGVPVLGLHPPPGLGTLERVDVDASTHQMLRLVARLQQLTGRRLDMNRLAEIVARSAQAAELWRGILALALAVPAPFTFFDTLVHLAPMVLLRGTAEAVDYYRLLKAELEQRVADGIAAVPGERFRFYWDGPPIWCALRPLSQCFSDARAAVVASTFGASWGLAGFDPHEPIESMARTYASVFANRSNDYKMAYLAGQVEAFGVDAAVFHDCRTTPETSHVRHAFAARVERLAGLPTIVLEADSHDPRVFSTDLLQRRLASFIEQRSEAAAAVMQ